MFTALNPKPLFASGLLECSKMLEKKTVIYYYGKQCGPNWCSSNYDHLFVIEINCDDSSYNTAVFTILNRQTSGGPYAHTRTHAHKLIIQRCQWQTAAGCFWDETEKPLCLSLSLLCLHCPPYCIISPFHREARVLNDYWLPHLYLRYAICYSMYS